MCSTESRLLLDTFWRNTAFATHETTLRSLVWSNECDKIANKIKAVKSYEEQAAKWYSRHPDATRSDF